MDQVPTDIHYAFLRKMSDEIFESYNFPIDEYFFIKQMVGFHEE